MLVGSKGKRWTFPALLAEDNSFPMAFVTLGDKSVIGVSFLVSWRGGNVACALLRDFSLTQL